MVTRHLLLPSLLKEGGKADVPALALTLRKACDSGCHLRLLRDVHDLYFLLHTDNMGERLPVPLCPDYVGQTHFCLSLGMLLPLHLTPLSAFSTE